MRSPSISPSPLPGYDFMVTSFDWQRRELRADGRAILLPVTVRFVRLRWWHRALSVPLTAALVWRTLRG